MMKIGLMIGEVPEVDPKNKTRAEQYWMYGASEAELAKAWGKPVEMAKLKKCANCEYFDNRASTLKALKAESGMGACKKFNFLCSQEAACQAWDCMEDKWEDEDASD
jgi:hypothetical protein